MFQIPCLTAYGITQAGRPAPQLSVEHDGLVAVHDHPILQMPAHRTAEDHPLDIPPLADQVLADRSP